MSKVGTFTQAPAQDLSREQAAARYAALRAKKARSVRIPLAIVATILVGAMVAGTLYYQHLNNLLATRDEELLTSLKQQASDEPFYMLLLGVDKGEERYDTEGTDSSLYRADTIMLARIDPRDTKATLMSIHRDLLVELENGEMGKINAAYSLGGPAGMVRQVSELAGVDISHYAEIDFDAFMSIVDAVGGVEVTLDVDVRDPDYTGLDLAAGTYVLNGHDALMLCRARHAYDAYGDGDVYRAANQRMVVSSIVRKVLASDPHTLVSAITAMANSVTTDLSLNDILALAAQMRDFDTNEDLYTGMTISEPEVIDEIYYEILDVPSWQSAMQRMDAGLPPYEVVEEDEAESAEVEAAESQEIAADKSGAVAVAGIVDGRATAVANDLAAQGFSAVAYEDPTFTFGENLVVYGNPALAGEAEALAAYLGDDFTPVLNDGSFYLISDIVVRLAA